MRLRNDFETDQEEIDYLKEQKEYWEQKYPVSGLISGLVKTSKLEIIKNRLRELTKND